MSSTTYKLLTVALSILVLVVGFQVYFILSGKSTSSRFVEEAQEEGQSMVDLALQQEYQDGYTLITERNFKEARETFLKLAEESDDPVAQMHARFLAADALYEAGAGDPISTIREFKALMADPEYEDVGNTIKLAAGTRIASIYINYPTEETFNEIFYREPDLFSSAAAPIDALPNQGDASLVNLHSFLSTAYGIDAENELELANALFNHNIDIYLKLFNACRADTSGTASGCNPDVDTLLTSEEREVYAGIEDELRTHLEAADVAIELLKQRSGYASTARALNRKTRVMHKAMYFGFTKPDEVEATAVESIDYAELANSPEGMFVTNLEYAILLALLEPQLSDERRAQVDLILAEIYKPDGKFRHLVPEHINVLNSVHSQIESGSYSVQNEMYMRGQLALSMINPGYKHFLEDEAGWDFDGVAIQTIMRNAGG